MLIAFYIPLGFIDANYKRLKNQLSGKGVGGAFFCG
jgi:hypothetical protein